MRKEKTYWSRVLGKGVFRTENWIIAMSDKMTTKKKDE